MSLNYELRHSEPIEIVFGNGSVANVDRETDIGPFNALICSDSDLVEDLISINPFLDSGYKLNLQGNGGYLEHIPIKEGVSVDRDGVKRLIDLEDIASLRDGSVRNEPDQVFVKYLSVNASTSKSSESQRRRVIRFHERMGHASTETMCNACDKGGAWSHSGLTATMIRRVMRKEPCLVCWLAKKNKEPVRDASGDLRDSVEPGQIISADIVGKISPPSRKGDNYFFRFADVCTGYQHAYTSTTKVAFVTALGEVAAYIKREKLHPEVSVPYAHYQNFVERYIQTAVKGVSTLIHGQRFLKANCFDKALYHFIDCWNHSPNSKCGQRSPHQVITGSPTNQQKTFQFAFGDLVSVNVPDELRGWKFDLRHDIGIYVGQPDHSVDGGLVYFPYSGAESVRTGLSLLTISDQAYQRYFSRRTDTRDAARLPWKDLENIVGDHIVDFEARSLKSDYGTFILQAPLAKGSHCRFKAEESTKTHR